MPKAKKIDEVTSLSLRMLDVLEIRRRQGEVDYPPTLQANLPSCVTSRPMMIACSRQSAREHSRRRPQPRRLARSAWSRRSTSRKTSRARRNSNGERLPKWQGGCSRVLEPKRRTRGRRLPPDPPSLGRIVRAEGPNTLVPKAATHETMVAEVTFANGGKPASDSRSSWSRDLRDRAEGDGTPPCSTFAFNGRISRVQRARGRGWRVTGLHPETTGIEAPETAPEAIRG